MKAIILKNKKNGIAALAITLFIALAVTLCSCDGGDGDMPERLAEITENCILFSVSSNEQNVSVYDAYLAYFRMYPEKFEDFYAEKKAEIEKSEIGKCGLYSPKIYFSAALPDGKSTNFYYDMVTRSIKASESLWNTYDYRYYELEGIYTEQEGGAIIIDGELRNVSGLSPESMVDSVFYARLKPASVRVTLNTDGGAFSSPTEFQADIGENILPYLNEIPEKAGYDFTGWRFTVGSKGGYPIAVMDFTAVQDQSLRILNDVNFLIRNARDEQGYNTQYNGKYEGYYSTDWYVTLEAQYQPKKHTVTYMNFDGTVFRTAEIDEGATLTQHNAAVLSAYACKGWSLTEGSESTFDKLTVDGDITLYPVAARVKTVTLYYSNGVTAVCRVYETYPLKLSATVPSGYGLLGWYLDSGHTVAVKESVIAFDELADAYYAVIESSQ